MLKRFAYIVSVVVVVLALPLSLVSRLRTTVIHFIAPITTPLIHSNSQIVELFYNIRQIPTLRQDKQHLEEKNLSLEQKLVITQDLIRENQALKSELGVTGVTRTYKKVVAQVVVRGTNSADQTFTVDVGTSSGIKVGQPAVSHGALIGKVITADASSAVIRSIVSRESRIQTWISESREKGLLVGDGSNTYLSDITQGVSVTDNATLETSGLGGSLPQGIVIGQVGAIQSKKSDLSQKFLVTLSQDPNSLESVFILLTDS
jgi:rod shape-determining protein MreC